MLVERSRLARDPRPARRPRALRAASGGASTKGTASSSTAASPVASHVVGDRVGQPEQVVGAAGARAAAAGDVPPVLHVALDELARGRAQQVLARRGPGRASDERHRVLELVAEAEGAARLVVAGAGPHAAGQVLVQEPAVQHHVERVVRASCTCTVPSISSHAAAHRARAPPRAAATLPKRCTRSRAWRGVRALAEDEDDRRLSPGWSSTATCSAAHGIEARAGASRERLARQRRRALRASRCGPGTRAGPRWPSAAARWPRRRPRGPGTPGCSRCARRPRRAAASSSVTTCRCSPARGGPSDHSL